jgi:hypothetical protein
MVSRLKSFPPKMQFTLLFTAINLIYAIAMPGIGSSLANSAERKISANAERVLQKSIDNPQSIKALKYLRDGQESIVVVQELHERRQRLMEKFINLANLMGNTEKAENIKARKARKAEEFNRRLDVLKEMALDAELAMGFFATPPPG